MSMEKLGSQIEEQPQLKQASNDDIAKVKNDIEFSQKLRKVNDVLEVLDLPDNQEDVFRKTLNNQDSTTLEELAKKGKNEILTFLTNQKNIQNIKTINDEKQNQQVEQNYKEKETQRIDNKISKIKSIFSNDILDKNPKIAEQFNLLDTTDNPTEKNKIFKEILEILKNPGTLKSIIDDLGGADKNNPKYLEFRNTLIGVDSSFESYFNDLENIKSGASFELDEVIDGIEKESGGMVDIDLKNGDAVSKLSLVGSNYSFDEKIDRNEIDEIMGESQEELDSLRNNFTTLKEFGVSFYSLSSEINKISGKPDFKANLKNIVNNFSKDIFTDLDDVYESMDIESNEQIKESDISSLAEINSLSELKNKMENIKAKIEVIRLEIGKIEVGLKQKYHTEIKELLQRKSEAKEKQLEVLKFMDSCGFDEFPKEITNRLIKDIQSNLLTIPGLELNKQNINLKNGNFGESSAFIDKEAGLNIASKTNLVKFVNKMISGNINEPLPVEAIATGTSVADPAFLKGDVDTHSLGHPYA